MGAPAPSSPTASASPSSRSTLSLSPPTVSMVASTTARERLRLIPTFCMDITVTDTATDMAAATTVLVDTMDLVTTAMLVTTTAKRKLSPIAQSYKLFTAPERQ